jgi:rfaE bifunctional protein kinase chain/domain
LASSPRSLSLPDFSRLRVLVVGDVMTDRYLYGTTDRISPEAPVPVIHYRGEEERLGGAANVALNLRALGCTVFLNSLIGADDAGERFRNLLAQAGLSAAGIVVSTGRCTTLKTRVLAGKQQLLRVDREDVRDADEEEETGLLTAFQRLLDQEQIDLVILQDYNKGVLTEKVIHRVIELAQASNIPIAVDPKKHHFWAYRNATFFKPNLREIQAQVDYPITPDLETLNRTAALIRERLGAPYVMITLGEHGLYLGTPDGAHLYPTEARSIADVSGAGDTVISVAAACLALDLPAAHIARLANLAAGDVVSRPGVVPVSLERLRDMV